MKIITCHVGGSDYHTFESVINQGIDSHLEAFTKSKFEVIQKRIGRCLIMQFDSSELPILVRRLREIGTEQSEQWADDIEACLERRR